MTANNYTWTTALQDKNTVGSWKTWWSALDGSKKRDLLRPIIVIASTLGLIVAYTLFVTPLWKAGVGVLEEYPDLEEVAALEILIVLLWPLVPPALALFCWLITRLFPRGGRSTRVTASATAQPMASASSTQPDADDQSPVMTYGVGTLRRTRGQPYRATGAAGTARKFQANAPTVPSSSPAASPTTPAPSPTPANPKRSFTTAHPRLTVVLIITALYSLVLGAWYLMISGYEEYGAIAGENVGWLLTLWPAGLLVFWLGWKTRAIEVLFNLLRGLSHVVMLVSLKLLGYQKALPAFRWSRPKTWKELVWNWKFPYWTFIGLVDVWILFHPPWGNLLTAGIFTWLAFWNAQFWFRGPFFGLKLDPKDIVNKTGLHWSGFPVFGLEILRGIDPHKASKAREEQKKKTPAWRTVLGMIVGFWPVIWLGPGILIFATMAMMYITQGTTTWSQLLWDVLAWPFNNFWWWMPWLLLSIAGPTLLYWIPFWIYYWR